jgi:hypothetical protein
MHKPYSKDINYQISNFGHLQANSKEKKKKNYTNKRRDQIYIND